MSSQRETGLTTPKAIIIAGLLIAGGIYFGLTSSSINLGRETASNINVVTPGQNPESQVVDSGVAGVQTVTSSIDDDAILGDPSAEVAVIEFSDYECPFCQRSFTQTMPSLNENYIAEGKVQYVFRDLPLPFHEPLATEKAIAANCAREQGGDEAYYEFHDALFEAGPGSETISEIAKDLRLNTSAFNTCIAATDAEDEVQGDLADAQAAGASGTPTYVVGKVMEDGTVEGELVVGAVPYAALKQVIDKYLET